MPIPTSSDFLGRFPEFEETTLSIVEGAIAEAGRATSDTQWGEVHTEAVSYLAAHILSIRVMQVGLQVGSSAGQPLGTGFTASLYGQEYERLRGTLALSGFAL